MPHDRRLTVWVTDDAYEQLAEEANSEGLKIGEYARSTLMRRLRERREVQEALHQLSVSVTARDSDGQPR